jgi:hypothetical protein
VVKGAVAGEPRGGLLLPSGSFQLDRENEPPILDADLRALTLTPGQELTYTCTPPGSGARLGLDRDEDGFFDGDESDLGTDPTDPADFPGAGAVPVRATVFKLRDDPTLPKDPARRRVRFRAADGRGIESGVEVPLWGSESDPTTGGATGGGAVLKLYRADRSEAVEYTLPAALWTRTGTSDRPGYRYRDVGGTQGPIRAITLRDSLLVVDGKGEGSYPLDGAPQGEMALRLILGSSLELCAVATAEQPAASRDTTSRFQGERNAAAPSDCPRTTVP